MGRHDEALADFNRAIELDPSLAGTFGAFLAGPPPTTGNQARPPGTGQPGRRDAPTRPPTTPARLRLTAAARPCGRGRLCGPAGAGRMGG